jgi:alcohol dehydrogenase
LGEELALLRPKTVLVVTGKTSLRKSRHHDVLRRALSGLAVEDAAPVEAPPTASEVQERLEALRGKAIDAVVAIGGGSVLDVGKLLALLLRQESDSVEALAASRLTVEREPLPCVAIPTTAGTGSEVTQYASFITPQRRKVTVEHPWLFPKLALVDPLLCASLPAYVTACTGFDALCQAVEAVWSLRCSPFADTHALRAIPLILGNLERAVREPTDRRARFAMSLASCEAGLAISQTRTTAVHSVSYPLTALFGIAHGHACALTLASFIRFNASSLTNGQGVALWRAMGVSSSEEAAQVVERMMDKVALERSLSRLGVDRAGVSRVVEQGFRPDRVGNNPRPLTPEALTEILQAL